MEAFSKRGHLLVAPDTRVAVTSTLRVKRRPRPGAWIVIRLDRGL